MSVHNDNDVLETSAKTLEFLCTEGSAIYTRCDIARSNIIDHCVNKYKEAIDEWRNLIAGRISRSILCYLNNYNSFSHYYLAEEPPNEDEIHSIIVSLKKVSILYSCHNLNPWGLLDSLYRDIEEYQNRQNLDYSLPNEVVKN